MAITLSLQDLVGSMDEATRRNLFAIACELVALEGGETAPDSVSNEAVVLVAAYLQKRQGGSTSEKNLGDLNIKYRAVGSAVRLSGARTLLSPWRVRDLPVEPT